jgi:hypothetical protein
VFGLGLASVGLVIILGTRRRGQHH